MSKGKSKDESEEAPPDRTAVASFWSKEMSEEQDAFTAEFEGDVRLRARGAKKNPKSTKSPEVDVKAVERAVRESKSRRKAEEPRSWKQIAIGIGFLLILCSGGIGTFFTIYDFFSADITYVDIRDEAQSPLVRDILLGGDPWIVYCTNTETEKKLVPQIMDAAEKLLRGQIRMAVMNCYDAPLPQSGKTIFERYGFSNSQMPGFVVANGEKPKQLTRNSFTTGETVADFARIAVKPNLKTLDSTKKVENLCFRKSGLCLLVGHKKQVSKQGRKNLQTLVRSEKKLKIGTVDTSRWKLKIDPELLPPRTPGKSDPKSFSVFCINNPDRSSDPDALTTGLVELGVQEEELKGDGGRIKDFMQRCKEGKGSEVFEPPAVKIRPPKVKKAKSTPPPRPAEASSPPSQPEKYDVDEEEDEERNFEYEDTRFHYDGEWEGEEEEDEDFVSLD